MAKNHTTVAEIHENDKNNDAYSATFCISDDKIRIYCGRVERETFNFLRQNKFTATPKQSCDFVAVWSPNVEDIALAMISEEDDIGDEDTSPEERAIDRAERFAGYRDKRRSEANGHADNYDAGPSAFGNQNRGRAERQASRHERHRGNALSQWSKAEYWQCRTVGVIGNALHRADARTRRGRILTIEADMRRASEGGRWHQHLQHRLNYENAMLAAEGGKVAEVEIVPGGFIGNHQILKVNRSPVTKRVVSVNINASWGFVKINGSRAYVDHGGVLNIERLGEDAYRAPTPEELAEFNDKQKEAKQASKATGKTAPSLINPTMEDAQKLQDIWNAGQPEDRKSKIAVMTQDQYSVRSKGSYAIASTVDLTERGRAYYQNYNGIEFAGHTAVCKVRKTSAGTGLYAANRVIVISDKPQKPLPWEAITELGDNPPTRQAAIATLPILEEARRGKNWFSDINPEARGLWMKAASWGFTSYQSESQFGITEAGRAALATVTPSQQKAQEPEPAVCNESTELETVAAGYLF